MKSVCVFCGSRDGSRPLYAEAARRMGVEIARRGFGLVYGGGGVGLMKVLADAALEGGGEVVGVIPEALMARELAHDNLSRLHVVGSMHERKKLMADLSEGFVALPGGYGTLEEFLEVISWAQLSIHEKPCGLLDVKGYFKSLTTLFDQAVTEGFLSQEHRSLVLREKDPQRLLDAMERYTPPGTRKWVVPEDL